MTETIGENNRQEMAEIIYKDIEKEFLLRTFKDTRFIPSMGLIQKLKNTRLCCLCSYYKNRRISRGGKSPNVLETYLIKGNKESKEFDLGFISECNDCRENGVKMFGLKENIKYKEY